ncbi:hypothetical protein V6N11_043569 [Hibiscus sabdariffa]|uniref:Uncharacterized protein n=1 Tax=Hibiscus sabdariffa TaxID=183260 RepID=A0ABR2RCM5_9ROSI
MDLSLVDGAQRVCMNRVSQQVSQPVTVEVSSHYNMTDQSDANGVHTSPRCSEEGSQNRVASDNEGDLVAPAADITTGSDNEVADNLSPRIVDGVVEGGSEVAGDAEAESMTADETGDHEVQPASAS